WEAGAKWSFAMPWYHYEYKLGGNHQYANKDWWQDWFGLDHAITMEEMKALKEEYLSRSSVSSVIETENVNSPEGWFTLQGTSIEKHVEPGIYIKDGKKVVVKP
ncbi:MAG: hypothetical protein K2I61_00870, partial [Muribaculaceae bacterium]|nr:hypothetical protein [Muribaculaceae bacterium]